MLITWINDGIAGRFRSKGEYARVGTHVAPAPEHVEILITNLLADYASSDEDYFLDRIPKFHLEFERIHPFNDGNGRIGRVLIHLQPTKLGYPPLIIRSKGKHDNYYPAFARFLDNKATKTLDDLLTLNLVESLNKRLAYLRGEQVVSLSDFAKTTDQSTNTLQNAARRQTIPAFREKGVWKIGSNTNLS